MVKKDKKKMQFLSTFNKYKVLAAQYMGDAMGHFPFRYYLCQKSSYNWGQSSFIQQKSSKFIYE